MKAKLIKRGAFFLSVLGCLSLFALPALCALDDDGHTFEIDDAKPLAKLGAQKLSVYVEPNARNAWLQGVSQDKVIWRKKMPLQEELNTAKTDVVCRAGKIVVLSQYGYSAAYVSQTFGWDGKSVSFLSKKHDDHSQREVDALTKLAASGTRSQLNAWKDGDHNIEYPGNYITAENMSKLLNGGARAAEALAKAKQYGAAATRLEICFDASAYLVGLGEGDLDVQGKPETWVQSWLQDSMQLPSSTWAPLLKSYTEYLKQSGKTRLVSHVSAQLNQGLKIEAARKLQDQKEAAAAAAKKAAAGGESKSP